jgi:excisionase family DNA binding protein
MASARRTQPPCAFAGRGLPATDEPLSATDLPMTVPEVARVLRTSPKAIYTMIERGQLPGVLRINRRVLVNRGALLDWLRQKSTPSLEGW